MANNLAPASVFAVEDPIEDNDKKTIDITPTFEYKIEDRPDPFYPFISKANAIRKSEDTIVVDDKELTGLQLFEPGQLKLVAVVATPNGPIGMAEDVAGKGYVLHEGVPIGQRGRITKIDNGQVFILETALTRAGRTITKEIVMRLRKETDK